MPISCDLKLRSISNDEFAAIDRVVMACAFASQNSLGRFCDEHVYENDLAARLRAAGFSDVSAQVPVVVSWRDFTKRHRLDLVVNQMIYELKAVAVLTGEHDAQAIHYATLLAVDRVKLLNFRPNRVVGRLKRCPMIAEKRFRVSIEATEWKPLSDRCAWLSELAGELFHDWGAFLDTRLYDDALKHFCGGEAACMRPVMVRRDGIELGIHRLSFHAERIPFLVTSYTSDFAAHEVHLQRLLRHTGLPGLQWLNFNHATLQLRTVLTDR